jgi:hypothetical protein
MWTCLYCADLGAEGAASPERRLPVCERLPIGTEMAITTGMPLMVTKTLGELFNHVLSEA